MRKNIKVSFAVLLAGILLLGAGCGKEPADVPGSTGNTTGNTAEPLPTGENQLPGDMDVALGVDQRDEDELNATAPTAADNSPSAQKPETKPDEDTQTQSPTQPDSGGQIVQPDSGNESMQPDSGEESTQPEAPDVPAPGSLTYQQFYQLDPDQQEAYTDSFESLSAFNKWFNEAKAAYESTIPDETVSGSVNIGKLNP